jgi:hypothetical protein
MSWVRIPSLTPRFVQVRDLKRRKTPRSKARTEHASTFPSINHATFGSVRGTAPAKDPGQLPLAVKALNAYEESHYEAAQALAVTITETAVARALGDKCADVKQKVLFDPELVRFTEMRLRAALALIFHRGGWLPLAGGLHSSWTWILGLGYDCGPAVGRVTGVPRAPGFPSLLGGTDLRWSYGVRDGLDALPGGGDLLCPGPGCGDLQGSAAPAADQAGSGVQDPVAQLLRARNWPDLDAVQVVERLPEDEAVALLEKIARSPVDEDGRRLVEELGGLALAIQQAGAYIRETSASYADYLQALRTDPLAVYDADLARAESVAARVWRRSLDHVARNHDDGPVTVMVGIISYLAPDDIPRQLFQAEAIAAVPALAGYGVVKLNRALGELAAYSLITLDQEAISVHRVVQHITRLDADARDTAVDYCSAAIGLLNACI